MTPLQKIRHALSESGVLALCKVAAVFLGAGVGVAIAWVIA